MKRTSASKSPTAKKANSSRKAAKPAASKSKVAATPKTSRPTRKRKAQQKSKGIIASAIKAVSEIFSPGEPNAIELLKKDHDTVEKLFEKIKEHEDGNNAATFKKIKAELDVHAHIEEMIFYPHLLDKGDKELKKIVREGVEEHAQVKTLLAELAGMPGDSPVFKAKITLLMENVEHHVKEEEDEMFPMVEDQIDAEMLQRLGSLMQGEKMKVKKMGAPPRTKQKAAAARR